MNTERRALILGGLFLLVVSACNFPLLARPADKPFSPSAEQTLDSLWFSTPSPAPSSEIDAPFQGLIPPIPGDPAATPLPGKFNYIIHPGDTLTSIEKRFQVDAAELEADFQLSPTGFLPAGKTITLPQPDPPFSFTGALLPDSEVIFSPSAASFNIDDFIRSSGGYLSQYIEQVDGETLSGSDIIRRVAVETSINPALLLGILEYRSGWVTSIPAGSAENSYPVGFQVSSYQGLYHELLLVSRFLSIGYYGWRSGDLTSLKLTDGTIIPIAPTLNPGSVALQSLFSLLCGQDSWIASLYGSDNFSSRYAALFGDPWRRAAVVEPLFPEGLQSPILELPFLPGLGWSFTGGPHISWGVGTPYGAVDFAPVTGEKACEPSSAWTTAAASGRIVRSANSIVVIDLDGDGLEQTGWVLLYMHVASEGRVPLGNLVHTDDRIGHPSCEGGKSTGAHVHIARKYNGEWIPADGPLPMILSGWMVHSGEKPYLGALTRGSQVVTAKSDGSSSSSIFR